MQRITIMLDRTREREAIQGCEEAGLKIQRVGDGFILGTIADLRVIEGIDGVISVHSEDDPLSPPPMT